MIGAVVLTFVITSLGMLVIFLRNDGSRQNSERKRIMKENDELRRQVEELRSIEQSRRERKAYDQGLYDGRSTDAIYRQCLKKYTAREQAEVILQGEKGEN